MEFLENRRSWENQEPPENRQKSGLFWASPFTMHLVCTLLIIFLDIVLIREWFCFSKGLYDRSPRAKLQWSCSRHFRKMLWGKESPEILGMSDNHCGKIVSTDTKWLLLKKIILKYFFETRNFLEAVLLSWRILRVQNRLKITKIILRELFS